MTERAVTVNNKVTVKAKAKPRGKPWPKGVSGNPNGAPKRGQSWVEVLQEVFDKTTDEICEELDSGELARAFHRMPKGIALKRLVAMRVATAIMFEPTPGLFNAVMDRVEGKAQQSVDVTSKGEKLEPSIIMFRDADENDNTAAITPSADTSGSGV